MRFMSRIMTLSMLLLILLVLNVGCGSSSSSDDKTYTLKYNANGSTGGEIPADATEYNKGDLVIVLGNKGGACKRKL